MSPATLQPSVAPILHVTVVGFHHQKGSTLEYVYPPLSPLTSSNESLTSSLPPQWKTLPHIALPDGCHNYDDGHVIFTLLSPTSDGCVFGVSCYRQIDSKDLPSPGSDVTRSTIQKSICILSRWPVFSVVEAKLKLATHAYFNAKDFNDTAILVELYDDLNSTLTLEHSLSICLHGYSVAGLVINCDHKLLQIFKAVLLQEKVLLHGSNPGQVSSYVMAVASLFPRSLESLIRTSSVSDLGFPLGVFPSETSLQPYISLQQMDLFTSKDSSCILSGAVNPLYINQHSKLVAVLYNIDTRQLIINKPELRTTLLLTSPDLRFSDSLRESVTTHKEAGGEGVRPGDWEGGEEWVRGQFKSYLLSLLSTTLRGDSATFDDFNSDFIKLFMKTKVYASWLHSHHMGIESFEPRHVFEGELSLGDIKRQLMVRAGEYGLDKVVTPTQVEQVGKGFMRVGCNWVMED